MSQFVRLKRCGPHQDLDLPSIRYDVFALKRFVTSLARPIANVVCLLRPYAPVEFTRMSNIFRLRIIVLAISIACLCQIPMVCSQQPGATAKKYSVRNLYAPSKNPDRIILTWSDDPATTQTVNWRTDSSVEQGYAEISEATDGPHFVRDLTRISSKIDELESSVGKSKYHHATFRDLKPSTKYVFRVGDGKNWSEFSQFTTASKTTEPFSFVYFGDAQNDIKSHWSRVVRESFKDAPRAKFFLHAGDLVNSANSEIEWGEWFYAAGWINRTIPSIATPGNHEYERGSLSRNWQPTFEFPKNGIASDIPRSRFEQKFIQVLSQKIANYFYDYEMKENVQPEVLGRTN